MAMNRKGRNSQRTSIYSLLTWVSKEIAIISYVTVPRNDLQPLKAVGKHTAVFSSLHGKYGTDLGKLFYISLCHKLFQLTKILQNVHKKNLQKVDFVV